jgi:hypothetical protein
LDAWAVVLVDVEFGRWIEKAWLVVAVLALRCCATVAVVDFALAFLVVVVLAAWCCATVALLDFGFE